MILIMKYCMFHFMYNLNSIRLRNKLNQTLNVPVQHKITHKNSKIEKKLDRTVRGGRTKSERVRKKRRRRPGR